MPPIEDPAPILLGHAQRSSSDDGLSHRVSSLTQVVGILESQGARIDVDDLRPELLGLNGYIGTTVEFPGRIERIWIRGMEVVQAATAPDSAYVAEWLTLALAGKEYVPVKALIREYLKMDLARGWPPILRAALLSHSATRMGFLWDPLQQNLWLPHDHPMAMCIILPTDAEIQRFGR